MPHKHQGWTGRRCPSCNGTGDRDDDGHSCQSCGGTGEEFGEVSADQCREEECNGS